MCNVNSTYKTCNAIEMVGDVESTECSACIQEATQEDGGEGRGKHSLEFD